MYIYTYVITNMHLHNYIQTQIEYPPERAYLFARPKIAYFRGVHRNEKCGIPIPPVRFLWEWKPNCLN